MSSEHVRKPDRFAFTLIELLVVVGIMALLIGLLVPALGRARAAGQSVQCTSNMRQIGVFLHLYCEDNDRWLPGPATSGRIYTSSASNNFGHWYARNRPVDTPLFNVDWISPTMGAGFLKLNESMWFGDRVVAILENQLYCPSNDVNNNPETFAGMIWGENGEIRPDEFRSSSYSMIQSFSLLPNEYEEITGQEAGTAAYAYYDNREGAEGLLYGYLPKLDRIGLPSSKVYVMEGCRFHAIGGGISFNALPWQRQGGNFMLFGPGDARSGNPWANNAFKRSGSVNDWLVRSTFRHIGGKLNQVFFDGSVRSASGPETLANPGWYEPQTAVDQRSRRSGSGGG